MATRSKKPKCDGSTSQSCGMSCISREDTCRELIAADVATKLMAVAKQHQQPNDAAGQAFDSVAANFPPKLLAKAHKTGVATSDLGNGATLTTKVATGLDGSSIKYGFVTDADGKRYTISDGLVKEVMSAAGSEWQEAFDAAVRSKVAKAQDFAKVENVVSEEVPKITSYSVTKTLGKGGFGIAELTDRGTVVKTFTTGRFIGTKLGGLLLQQEYDGLAAIHSLGLGGKPLALDFKNGAIEMEYVEGKTLAEMEDSGDDSLEGYYPKISAAMLKLHKAGFTHNDLHSGNIMLHEGKVSFIDAGFVGKVGTVLASVSSVKDSIAVRSGLNDLSYVNESILSAVQKKLLSNGSLDRFRKAKGDIMTRTVQTMADAELELHQSYIKALDELGL